MATIHVRSVPDALVAQVRELAQAKQRSLSAEVVALLETALAAESRHQQQANVLDAIRRRRFIPPAGAPDSVDLLREDRAR